MLIKIKEKIDIKAPGNVAEMFQKILAAENEIDRDKEHFWTVGINANNTIKYIELVSLGTLESSLVHSRETFRLAILKAASRIVVAHNHPSGTLAHLPQFASIFRKIQQYFFRKLKHFKPWFLKTGCSAEKPLATVL
ncbi:MAG: JAB domain-containing protein [Proteobacteria bacterium]|nr:JAB domain-containing protein [Pseudomonadota bacterium]